MKHRTYPYDGFFGRRWPEVDWNELCVCGGQWCVHGRLPGTDLSKDGPEQYMGPCSEPGCGCERFRMTRNAEPDPAETFTTLFEVGP